MAIRAGSPTSPRLAASMPRAGQHALPVGTVHCLAVGTAVGSVARAAVVEGEVAAAVAVEAAVVVVVAAQGCLCPMITRSDSNGMAPH